jgi:signal transduction histidine kinase/CheY-like chemotaxis protein
MNQKKVIFIYTLIIGIILYFVDSVFFYIEFNDNYTFAEALITNVPFWEFFSRILMLTILVIGAMLVNEKIKDSYLKGKYSKSKTLPVPKGQLNFNFLSSLSFQIRTPLNAIIGFSELLKTPNLPAESKEFYINHVNSSSKYLLLLINNLSEITKIDSNDLHVKKQPCNIPDMIEDLFPAFQAKKIELGKPDISLVVEASKINENFSILTDPDRLKQIFSNLLENALVNSLTGIVKLGYKVKTDAFVEFYIMDSGRGISQERLETIFERYNKLTDNQNIPFDGSVLRLAISKSLIKLLGGEIRADSVVGQGTTIYFTMPYVKTVQKAKENKTDLKQASTASVNWADRLILICEDVDSNYIYLTELLKPTRVKILWAKNGIEAVEFVKTNPKIELVLMDILMPEMDGYQASREIKSIRKNLPIIAQTACAIEGGETSEQNINFDSYLTKPIWLPQLMSTLGKYIF